MSVFFEVKRQPLEIAITCPSERQMTAKSTILVLLSGPLAVGKTSLAEALINEVGFSTVSTRGYLEELTSKSGMEVSRRALQHLGDSLDERTNYQWVRHEVLEPAITASPDTRRWLLDCVRKRGQVHDIREAKCARPIHVHLAAPEDVLRARYTARQAQPGRGDLVPYEEAVSHPNEVESRALIEIADLIVRTDQVSPSDLAQSIWAHCETHQ